METQQKGSSVVVVLVIVVVIGAALWWATGSVGIQSSTQSSSSEVAPAASSDETVSAPDALPADDASSVEEASEMMKKDEAMMEESHEGDSMEKTTDDAMEESAMEEAVMEKDESVNTEAAAPAVSGSFEAYSADKLALASSGDVVLFFHAEWCPTCRALERDINGNTIPENVHILKVDYDSATALKQKYGVTKQHTLVVVDAAGNEIKKIAPPTNTLAQVVAGI